MSDEPDWSPDERAQLDALPRTAAPSQALESRVVRSLREQGLLQPRGAGRLSWTAVAASLAMFVFGAAAGRATSPRPRTSAPAAEGRSYILLLQSGATDPADAGAETRRVAEYAAWARTLRGEGRLLGGEKLADRARVLRGPTVAPREAESDPILGYFVIRARDFDEAERIARSCPHLRHGGIVVVREIEKT